MRQKAEKSNMESLQSRVTKNKSAICQSMTQFSPWVMPSVRGKVTLFLRMPLNTKNPFLSSWVLENSMCTFLACNYHAFSVSPFMKMWMIIHRGKADPKTPNAAETSTTSPPDYPSVLKMRLGKLKGKNLKHCNGRCCWEKKILITIWWQNHPPYPGLQVCVQTNSKALNKNVKPNQPTNQNISPLK